VEGAALPVFALDDIAGLADFIAGAPRVAASRGST
jgi:hypothetical protein